MAGERDEVHVDTDEARGGSTPHVVRWMLGISLVAAIVLLSAIWMFGAATQGDREEEITATGIAQDRQDDMGSDTDGILIENADELDTGDDADPLYLPNQPEAAGDR